MEDTLIQKHILTTLANLRVMITTHIQDQERDHVKLFSLIGDYVETFKANDILRGYLESPAIDDLYKFYKIWSESDKNLTMPTTTNFISAYRKWVKDK